MTRSAPRTALHDAPDRMRVDYILNDEDRLHKPASLVSPRSVVPSTATGSKSMTTDTRFALSRDPHAADPATRTQQRGRHGHRPGHQGGAHAGSSHPQAAGGGAGSRSSSNSGAYHAATSAAPARERKKFECEQCGFVFGMRSNLKRHVMTVHEDRRAWRCEQCGASFGLKQNLNTHVRVKHEKRRPFVCEVCTASFGYKQVLQNHRRNIHGLH